MSHPIPPSLTIMWWNMHFTTFGKDNRYAIKTIEDAGIPDVLCLQEYVTGGDDRLLRWLEERNYTINFLHFSEHGIYRHGVMTAVRPGLSQTMTQCVLREDAPIRQRPFANRRGLIELKLRMGEQTLNILNIHLTYPRAHTRLMRSREFMALQELLDGEYAGQPRLLGGDFNFFARDVRRQYLTTRYQYFSGGLIHKTWRPVSRYSPVGINLDYVFWQNLAAVPTGRLAPFSRSDHRPLVITLPLAD